MLGDAGLALQIIRHPDPQRRELNTVFTLELMIGVTLSAAMILVAPAGAAFFHEPRLTWVIRALALRPVLTGLQNPGIALFRKHMIFNKDFEFLVLNKVVSFFIVLLLAADAARLLGAGGRHPGREPDLHRAVLSHAPVPAAAAS